MSWKSSAFCRKGRVSRNDTPSGDTCVGKTHGWRARSLARDLPSQETSGRAGVLFDRYRPTLVLPAQLGHRDAALSPHDGADKVDASVPGRVLQQSERTTALLDGQPGERLWRAYNRAQLNIRRPVGDAGDVALDAVGETRLLRGIHHPLQRLHLTIDGRHIAAVGRQIQRGAIDVPACDQNFGFRRWVDLPRENAIGSNAPVLGTAIFLEHSETLSPPGSV